MDNKKRITIKDVAREAGVSTQTISRFINNHPDIAPETQKRIAEVISRLGYQPSAIARKLIQKRSQNLAVVASGHEYYGPSGMAVVGIEQQAYALGYSLLLRLLHPPETPHVEKVINDLLAQDVDGIIWAVPEIGENRSWWKKTKPVFRVPVIFLSMQAVPGLLVVAVDNRQGARLATEHLLQNGYRNIGMITGPSGWWEVNERVMGWRDALSSYGIIPGENQITPPGSWGPSTGEEGLRYLLKHFPEMDALFTSNDHQSLGALKVAHELKIRVPQDLALVGFDNRPEAAYYYPPLTTVHQPLKEVGSLAVRELHRIITGDASEEDTGAILLQPRLIVRESSCVR